MVNNKKKKEGLTLKDLMERVGLTEPALSQRLGVGIRTISYWKARKQVPRLDNALALAKELNVSVKVLATSLGLDIDDVPNDQAEEI